MNFVRGKLASIVFRSVACIVAYSCLLCGQNIPRRSSRTLADVNRVNRLCMQRYLFAVRLVPIAGHAKCIYERLIIRGLAETLNRHKQGPGCTRGRVL